MRNRTENPISSSLSRCVYSVLIALSCVGLVSLVLVSACGHEPQLSKSVSSGEWLEFQGTWTAVGSRNTMVLGGDRQASISTFDGSLVLAGPLRQEVGFRSEAIVFSDSATGLVGRAVWTDEHGNHVYSELRGEGNAKHNKITGTFVGGTGRYSGAMGTYEFSWRFVVENEDGTLQGQSMGLSGRVRLDSERTGAGAGALRS